MPTTKDVWEFIFKDQIKNTDTITKEKLSSVLKDKNPFLGVYEEGQKVLFFLTNEIVKKGADKNIIEMEMTMNTLTYPNAFDIFIDMYNFERMVNSVPACIEKENMTLVDELDTIGTIRDLAYDDEYE